MTLNKWLDYQQNIHYQKIDLGLERIAKVYHRLFPNGVDFKVITIAGTNGKGSTGCFLANIFHQAQIDYAWFSSPHIDKYNERFVINNNLATDNEIISAFEKIEKIRENISLSYFEFSTLAAILIFSAKNIKVAILEIGLGGRLDSVNVVANDVAIITSIALDHQQYLGDSIKEIAFEKAGIIDKNCLIPDNLTQVAKDIIKSKKSKLTIVEKYQKPLKMQGVWQQYNANLAKTAALNLFTIDAEIIDYALQNAKLSARAEFIQYQNKTIIFDTAHNPQAVANLATLIPKNSIAIFAALKDKDVKSMILAIKNQINCWYIAPIIGARIIKNSEINQYFNDEKVILSTTIIECIEDALKDNCQTIVVFGSFLTISQVKSVLFDN